MSLTVHVCHRCGYEWASRLDRAPAQCPKCHNRNWQTYAPVRPPRAQQPPRPVDPNRARYADALSHLAIGESVLFSWHNTPDGQDRDDSKNASMNSSISQFERRYGWKFQREPLPAGLRLTRTA